MSTATDYSPLVRELFLNPRAAGTLMDEDAAVVHGDAGSVASGAWVRLHLRIVGGRVTDARFQAYGCPHTLAAASWLATRLPGRPVDDLLRHRALTARRIVSAARLTAASRVLRLSIAVWMGPPWARWRS